MLPVLGIFLLLYGMLIAWYTFYWNKPQTWPVQETLPRLTVLVAARNEADHLPTLLRSLTAQDYPPGQWHALIINDHSEDDTAEVVRQFGDERISVWDMPADKFGKKAAIQLGIRHVETGILLITDADCHLPPCWMRTLASGFSEAHSFIAAPVRYAYKSGLLGVFQTLDFLVLQGITVASAAAGKPSMCNGANLGYTVEAFEAVRGFEGIDHKASGDDMLLMHKMEERRPGTVRYCKDASAIVDSVPPDTWSGFLQQRKRWASKSSAYQRPGLKIVLAFIFLVNLLLLVCFCLGFFHSVYWLYFFGALVVKTLIEWRFVCDVARFFAQGSLMKYFFLMQPLHVFYTVGVGLWSQFGKYNWKGRRVS